MWNGEGEKNDQCALMEHAYPYSNVANINQSKHVPKNLIAIFPSAQIKSSF